jgi:hypothetical protein
MILPCEYDGHCEVNKVTRRACGSCRLRKCSAIGMSADRIRKEDYRGKNYLLAIKCNKTQALECKIIMVCTN